MLNYMKPRGSRSAHDFVMFDDQSVPGVNAAVALIRSIDPAAAGKPPHSIAVWRERNLVEGGTFTEIGTTRGWAGGA